MPSEGPVEKRQPRAEPERRSRAGPPSSSIMQGYENMGTRGRRKLFSLGVAMLIAGVGVGLFGAALTLYRFIFVVIVVLLGTGFVFPQYGIKAMELVVPLLKRPDRRGE